MCLNLCEWIRDEGKRSSAYHRATNWASVLYQVHGHAHLLWIRDVATKKLLFSIPNLQWLLELFMCRWPEWKYIPNQLEKISAGNFQQTKIYQCGLRDLPKPTMSCLGVGLFVGQISSHPPPCWAAMLPPHTSYELCERYFALCLQHTEAWSS